MRQLLFVLFLALISSKIYSQIPSWENTKDWKLYDINRPDQFNISVDSLVHFRHVLLNSDSMINFVKSVSIISDLRRPVWMGFYVISYTIENGAIEKIEAGQYGGYFYDEKTKKYYELPLEIRKDWLNYLSKKGELLNN